MVAILGSKESGLRDLLAALTGLQPKADSFVDAELETKYYFASVRFVLLQHEELSAADDAPLPQLELLKKAEAVIALWDLKSRESFEAITQLGAFSQALDDESFGEGPDRIQLCVGRAAAGVPQEESEALEDEAREWCIDHGFELLVCSLEEGDLVSLAQRRSAPPASGGLLDVDTDGTALRILEALQCHSWPNMRRKDPQQRSPNAPPPALAEPQVEEGTEGAKEPQSAGTAQAEGHFDQGAAVDEMEQFVEEMRNVRATSDERERRERACDLALKLAAQLGIDSESEGEAGSPR